MSYIVEEVQNKKQAEEFLLLPVTLYKEDPHWVRPLDDDIRKVFDPERNPYFSHGECTRWLLRSEDGSCVGRVASFIDEDTARLDSYTVGGMGFFECINDRDAAFKLFDRCREWLQARGMDAMEGPVNFGERNDWWGLLVDGFKQPNYGMPYTHQYYIKFFEDYGFKDYFQQYTFRTALVNDNLSKILLLKSERLMRDRNYKITHYGKMTPKQAKDAFLEIYNSAWGQDLHGVGSMNMDQVEVMFKNLKSILDPDLLTFAFYKDRPIGFFIQIPELNYIIKHLNGKLDLIGKLKFLYYRYINRTDVALALIFGVVNDFQSRGVEAAMIKYFCDHIIGNSHYKWLELSWIGDFNPQMVHLMDYINAKRCRTHITYRKLFREDAVFIRSADKNR